VRTAESILLSGNSWTVAITGADRCGVYVYDTSGNYIASESEYYWKTLPHTFTLSGERKIKFVFSTSDDAQITPSKVSRPMLVKGSTAPSTYIPYGYKLPFTLTSGTESKDTDIYIGDSKLGAEEYVDYEEQKMYKRTAQLLPPYEMDEGASQKGYYLTLAGIVAASSTAYNYVTGYIGVLPLETYALKNFPGNSTAICYYDTNKEYVSGETYNNRGSFTVTTPANCQFVRMTAQDRDPNTNVFVKGNEIPETYIPYLQPTDPPLPFPELEAYKGTNTLDSTETLGEVTIKGQIKPQS
jgi:hypothetical protein